jgi:hypothetical protein
MCCGLENAFGVLLNCRKYSFPVVLVVNTARYFFLQLDIVPGASPFVGRFVSVLAQLGKYCVLVLIGNSLRILACKVVVTVVAYTRLSPYLLSIHPVNCSDIIVKLSTSVARVGEEFLCRNLMWSLSLTCAIG